MLRQFSKEEHVKAKADESAVIGGAVGRRGGAGRRALGHPPPLPPLGLGQDLLTPMDPQADESRAAVMLTFVNQAAPNIRKKNYKR